MNTFYKSNERLLTWSAPQSNGNKRNLFDFQIFAEDWNQERSHVTDNAILIDLCDIGFLLVAPKQ